MVCKREILIVLVLIIFMTKVNAEEISLSNLPLEKKVGQMIIVKSNDGFNEHFVSLGIGGVFLDGGKKPSEFGEIKNKEEARALGKEHAKKLKEAGFNIDFSPVVESKNKVWIGRSFNGSFEERKEKIESYIEGLQENGIIATAKHYPGGSM